MPMHRSVVDTQPEPHMEVFPAVAKFRSALAMRSFGVRPDPDVRALTLDTECTPRQASAACSLGHGAGRRAAPFLETNEAVPGGAKSR